MNIRRPYCSIFCTALAFFGCEQPFDARGPLDQEIILYSVLSTDRDVQFVRVEQSYMPQSMDPTAYTDATYLSDARVTMTTGSKAWLLRDTVLPRSDTLRYKNPIHAFAVNLRVGAGTAYRIDIVHPRFGRAFSVVRLPAKPALAVDYFSIGVIEQPSSHPNNANILFTVDLGYSTAGTIGRMFVDYEVLIDGEWTPERVEIPERYQSMDTHDYAYVLYPGLVQQASYRTVGVFKNELYQQALTAISYNKYRTNKIIFDRIVFRFLEVELNLYDYLIQYADPHSMRLDQPSYSNVGGGLGLVGAYTLDSLIYLLPENFSFNH